MYLSIFLFVNFYTIRYGDTFEQTTKGGSRNIERGGLGRGSGGSAPGKIFEH